MDPLIAAELMQMMSTNNTFGFNRGMYDLQSTGGLSLLSAMSMPGFRGGYSSPIGGNPMPDISALAPLQLDRYGPFGAIAGTIGSQYISELLAKQGVLPYGNSGSYLQSRRTREYRMMQSTVGASVAGQEAKGFYRTFRGAAALAGQPFDKQQQGAAQDLADTFASMSPMLAMNNPELLDAIAGERGSMQALSSQMMEANRYRLDPITGKQGYSSDSNKNLITGVFNTMFEQDNMARMHGMRAGDIGQLYRGLHAEGLVGQQASLKARTLSALSELRNEGNLTEIGQKAGVALTETSNLEGLSAENLNKLRQNTSVKTKISDAEVKQISGQLQGYVDSLTAMREVFGENGNLNAPMPQLINALKALSSGQLQQFDSKQLTEMVRTVQALSQTSGKSIDQLVAMGQLANANNSAIVGPAHGPQFNRQSVSIGVAAGQAHVETGSATGFGLLSREQVEQAKMSLFSRGLGSDMGNIMGVLTRVEQAGGFANNQAGKQLTSILKSADTHQTTYTVDGVTRAMPVTMAEYRQLAAEGGMSGISLGDFNALAIQQTSNLRALATNTDRQQAALDNQGAELNTFAARNIGNQLVNRKEFENVTELTKRTDIANALGAAALDSLSALSLEEVQNDKVRNATMSKALHRAAAAQGLTLTASEADNMAMLAFGTAEASVNVFGFQSWGAKEQALGLRASQSTREKQAENDTTAKVNDAMSGLGPKGSLLQRMITAVQKQGDRGTDADITTLISDMFGADMGSIASKMKEPLQKITAKEVEIDTLRSQLRGASPADMAVLQQKISAGAVQLKAQVADSMAIADALGLTTREGKFDLLDAVSGERAGADITAARQLSLAKTQARAREVTAEDRTAAAGTKLVKSDLPAIAQVNRQTALAKIAGYTATDLTGSAKKVYDEAIGAGAPAATALAHAKAYLEKAVDSVTAGTKRLESVYTLDTMDTLLGHLPEAQQTAIIQAQRGAAAVAADAKGTSLPADAYTEENRQKARAESLTTGLARDKQIGVNLDVINNVRAEYIGDVDTVRRGGAAGVAAVNKGRESAAALERMATAYFGDNRGLMLSSTGLGMTDVGAHRALSEHANLGDEEKERIRKKLKDDGRTVSEEITLGEYKSYLALQANEHQANLLKSNKELRVGLTEIDETAEQKQIKKRIKLEDEVNTKTFTGTLATARITKEVYLDAMKAGTKFEDANEDSITIRNAKEALNRHTEEYKKTGGDVDINKKTQQERAEREEAKVTAQALKDKSDAGVQTEAIMKELGITDATQKKELRALLAASTLDTENKAEIAATLKAVKGLGRLPTVFSGTQPTGGFSPGPSGTETSPDQTDNERMQLFARDYDEAIKSKDPAGIMNLSAKYGIVEEEVTKYGKVVTDKLKMHEGYGEYTAESLKGALTKSASEEQAKADAAKVMNVAGTLEVVGFIHGQGTLDAKIGAAT